MATPTPNSPEAVPADGTTMSRRKVLTGAAVAVGGALASALPATAAVQQAVPNGSDIPEDATKVLGPPTSASSPRSPFVKSARAPTGAVSGSSFSPIHEITGTITPTDLHFERHHGGVAMIDPARHRLVVHGLVERPLVFTLDDLRAFPSVSRIHFLECAGNGRQGYKAPKPELSPQQVDGLVSNGEWTGVPARFLLAEAGVRAEGTWVLAEGGDAARMSRSIPIAKLMDDALIAWAHNGEPLRPAAGYPMRLILPGWEGNTNVKWLRRLEILREPNMSRDETSKYTDPLPNDSARQFSFEMDAKSTITYPTYPVRLAKPGWVQIAGWAWSGRGRITAVDVSVDGGKTWYTAELSEPRLPKAVTRFTLPWKWDGREATLLSRAVDETGYVQPTHEVFRATRGPGTDYHYNHIRPWIVRADGQVVYGVSA